MAETYAGPLPRPTPETRPFWDAAKQHRLVIQACDDCGTRYFYPRPLCPACRSFDYDWALASGRGVVHTFTIVHRPTLPAFEAQLPYNVIVVRLEEGPFMVSNLIDYAPDDLRIDLPVEVMFEPLDDDIALPKFRPRRGA